MLEKLKSLELKGPMKSSKISQIFSFISPEINTKIESRLSQFKTANDFYNYYTNKDINSYLNELNKLNINLSNIYDNYYPSNFSHTDKKISIIAKMLLLSKLIINIQDIINEQLISVKKYLYNIFYSNNEFAVEQNIYQNLNNLLQNITNIQNNSNSKQKINQQKISKDNSLNNETSIKNIYRNSFCNNIDINSPKKNTIYELSDNQTTGDQTPTFDKENFFIRNTKSLNIKLFYRKENKEILKETSDKEVEQRNSQLSFSDSIFVVEQSKKNLIEKKKNNEKDLKDLLNNNNKTKIYTYLLEIIKSSYHSCYINAEEKFKLKKLIISKPRLIEEIYITFLKTGNNQKNKILDYLKNHL